MESHVLPLIHQSVERFQSGDLTAAETTLKKVLELDPQNFAGLHVMGLVHVLQQNHEAAEHFLRQAVAVNPASALANYNLAIALAGAGKDLDALPVHAQAVALAPNNQDAWVNYGKSLSALKRREEAMACYDKALAIDPEHMAALGNRGALLAELKRNEEALLCFEKVKKLDARHPAVWLNMANTLRNLKRYDEALVHYEQAIERDPKNTDLWCNKANVLANLKRYDEALAHYDHAIRLTPENADAWYNKGYALTVLKRYDEALAHYERAIALSPDNADVWYIMGNTLVELKRYEEAIACFDRALTINPEHEFLLGDRLSAKRTICDWRDADAQLAELVMQIDNDKSPCTPFTVLSVLDSPALQMKTALRYAENFPVNHAIGAIHKRAPTGKIRIGYFTKDFHEHATSFLAAELFELHDKNKFEIVAISYGPEKFDKMRVRLLQAFDQFVDVCDKADMEIAQMSREMGIDIAVDMQGYQTEHRPGIFACRAAPIQVNFLAYPGTLGAEYMNYLIADSTLIPEDHRPYYSEKIVYMPDTYQPNDRKRAIASRQWTREELGLPASGFVFCCFNNNYKITPNVFDVWMRILKQVDGSVLWLLEDNVFATRNLRAEAEKRGVSGERLVFAKFASHAEHLARHRAADLFLDTLPYNAHTTASDALWVGLPLLTCMGQSFPSRVAASLLKAVDLPELIAASASDYERMAVDLATQPDKLSAIARKLTDKRTIAPLFDTPRYVKHLETAYAAMYERYQSHLSPDHIIVANT